MRLIFQLLIALLLVTGCKKNGELVEQNDYAILTVKLDYMVDQDNVYRIELQDNLFADGLTYADENKRMVSEKKYIVTQDKKHFVVYENASNEKVLDTFLTLKVRDHVTLVQLETGAAPTILTSASGDETDPDPDKTKVRFIYNDPTLPDSIHLRIYTCNVNDFYALWDYSVDPPTHLFTDSLILNAHKDKFSEYIQLDYKKYDQSVNPSYILEIYDLQTGAIIQKTLLYDYYFAPGNLQGILQVNNDLSPKYKFFNLKIKSRLVDFLSTGNLTEYFDEFMYGIPW